MTAPAIELVALDMAGTTIDDGGAVYEALRGAVEDAGWARAAADLTAADIVGLIHLVAQYQVFALVNNVLRVPLEPALRPLEGLDAAA